MGRLFVRNITNTKKPTSALAEIQHKRRYFVSTPLIQIIEYFWWYTNIRNRYIYGYFSRLWTDFDQTKMILSFKLYVLSNLTLCISLSHKQIILCSALCNRTQLSLHIASNFNSSNHWPCIVERHLYKTQPFERLLYFIIDGALQYV